MLPAARRYLALKQSDMKTFDLLPVLVLLLLGSDSAAQEKETPRHALGVSAGATASGNGYGMRYAATAYYKSGSNTFRLGALLQKRKNNLSGFDLRWERYLSQQDSVHSAELFVFVQGAYNHEAYLCFRELQIESTANVEGRIDASDLRFRSVEAAAGFGVNWHLTPRLQWVSVVGLGSYYTLNFPGRLYYSGQGAGLMLRSELAVRLNP